MHISKAHAINLTTLHSRVSNKIAQPFAAITNHSGRMSVNVLHHAISRRKTRMSQRKRGSITAVNTQTEAHANNNLCFVTDVGRNIKFLIDTGANINLVPQTFSKKNKFESAGMLYAANGNKFATYGGGFSRLNFGSNLNYSWVFLVTKVQYSTLDADFLKHFQNHH